MRNVGSDALVDTGVRLFTPVVEHVYAVLLRVGVLTVED
ncbi:Rv1535 domain-containing protein [Mycolicibacterium palauense]